MTWAPAGPWLSYAIPIVVVLAVLALRLRSMRRERRLRLETLWILPAFFLLLVGIVLRATPPTATGWALMLGLAAIGGAVGWQRGRTMRITIDPATHRLSQRASPTALLFVVAIIVARNAVRIGEDAAGGFDPQLVTEGLLGFGLGLIAATRIEWYLRGRALLRAARNGRDAE